MIELMNEPPTIDMPSLYRLYKACYDAVRSVAPDIAIGVADVGSDALWSSDAAYPKDVKAWLRNATHLFYAFHCYGCKPSETVSNAVKLSTLWGAATFLTEFGNGGADGGDTGEAAAKQGVGWTEYQYNGYCNVPCNEGQNTCRPPSPSPSPSPPCHPGQPCAFGACIT